jgi:hypothetical protein
MDQEERGTEVVIPAIHRAMPACEPRHWIALKNALASCTSAAPKGAPFRLFKHLFFNTPDFFKWSSPA